MQILGSVLRWASERHRVKDKPLLDSNPVDWLTQIRRWFPPIIRQGTIPDNRLAELYSAVMLQPKIAKDYILLVLFSGLSLEPPSTSISAAQQVPAKTFRLRHTTLP